MQFPGTAATANAKLRRQNCNYAVLVVRHKIKRMISKTMVPGVIHWSAKFVSHRIVRTAGNYIHLKRRRSIPQLVNSGSAQKEIAS